MTRQQKYPNTKYFTYYNANYKNKITCDCTIRAISKVSNVDYENIFLRMFRLALNEGLMPNDPKFEKIYLEHYDYKKMPEPRKSDNTKMTVKEFINKNPHITCVATVGSHHLTAIVDGKVYDIWDCTNQTMHTYFIK